ncbi:hypothetical protein [Roseicyclus sp.]
MRFKKPDDEKLTGKISLPTFTSGKALRMGGVAAIALTSSLALTGCETSSDGSVLVRADGTPIWIFDNDPEAHEARQRDRAAREAAPQNDTQRLSIASEDNDGGRVC